MEDLFTPNDYSHLLNQLKDLSIKTNKVGYVFDERMLNHKQFEEKHVERPERAMSIYMNLIFKGLNNELIRLPSQEILEEELSYIHKHEYISKISKIPFEKGTEKLRSKNENKYQNADTYDNYATFEAAKISAGCLISCCKSVATGKVDNAFAIIRPPGHHANSHECRGFCFFNNVAVAADYLIRNYKYKVAIVDWDVHHGDGTQEIFYEKKNPLFISLHRYDNGKFYPGTGSAAEIGKNEGHGYTINIPWNTSSFTKSRSSIGDDEYFYAFETIILPVLNDYKPDVILVSCGFDAAENDPLGEMSLSPLGYSYMTYQLKNITSKIIVALEGGYNLDSLARCSEAVIRTLLNQSNPFKDILIKKEINNLNLDIYSLNKLFFAPSSYAIEQVNSVKKVLAPYWSTLADVNELIIDKKLLRRDNIGINDFIKNKNLTENILFTSQEYANFKSDFMKFRIGKCSFPENLNLIHPAKYKKIINIDNRTLSKKLNFRLEGISLDIHNHKAKFKERDFNWIKRYGIYDTTGDDITYLVSKFLIQNKVPKSVFIEALKKFTLIYKANFMSGSENEVYDLFNVDLVVIPIIPKDDSSNDEKLTEISETPKKDVKNEKKSKKKKKTSDIEIKINGVKEYSLSVIKKENQCEEQNNFYNGLKSMISFFKDNIIE